MRNRIPLLFAILSLAAASLACSLFAGGLESPAPTPALPDPTRTPAPTPTRLPPIPVEPGAKNPDEPVFVSGDIPYTSPFFVNMIAEPFVMLEDQAGFARRDKEFRFALEGQTIGPVQVDDDLNLTYSLALPAIPQGTYLDLDNDGEGDTGVQVFAVAYWFNTWGAPFLEERDGKGWSSAHASTITDPEDDYEITGGHLIVWSPDDQQAFPSGFGEDGKLFTEDDPVEPIASGYSLVDLNDEPFVVSKSARIELTLIEGQGELKDYSDMDYEAAFRRMLEKVAREYPFTDLKNIDWQQLTETYAQRVAEADNTEDFYRAVRDFTHEIPDGHVSVSFNAQVFYEEQGGSFGMVLAELSDGRIIAAQVLPNLPADQAGIQPGAEIVEWQGRPVQEALAEVNPYLGPYSTDHDRRLDQLIFLTRMPVGERVRLSFKNPGAGSTQNANMQAEVDYDSLFAALPTLQGDELAMPIEGWILEDSGLGYLRINTFSDDYSLMAKLWERYITELIDNEIPGLILDLRVNSGGSSGLSLDFASYFFDQEIEVYEGYYYNENSQQFEPTGYPASILPAPKYYDGPIAVLVSSDCFSACEGFSHAMSLEDRSILVGHSPTAGAFGEVGLGQYKLPGDLSLQFPTGRPITPDGDILIEGVGVQPDILVPVTYESAMGRVDAVLEAAIEALLEE